MPGIHLRQRTEQCDAIRTRNVIAVDHATQRLQLVVLGVAGIHLVLITQDGLLIGTLTLEQFEVVAQTRQLVFREETHITTQRRIENGA